LSLYLPWRYHYDPKSLNPGQVLQGPEKCFPIRRSSTHLYLWVGYWLKVQVDCLNELSWKRTYKCNVWVDNTQPKQPWFLFWGTMWFSQHDFLGVTSVLLKWWEVLQLYCECFHGLVNQLHGWYWEFQR
jgi:hypothetical protein